MYATIEKGTVVDGTIEVPIHRARSEPSSVEGNESHVPAFFSSSLLPPSPSLSLFSECQPVGRFMRLDQSAVIIRYVTASGFDNTSEGRRDLDLRVCHVSKSELQHLAMPVLSRKASYQ